MTLNQFVDIQEVINTYYKVQLDLNNKFLIEFFYLDKPPLFVVNTTITLERLNYFVSKDTLNSISIIVNSEEFTYQYRQNAWYRIL